MDTQRPIWRLHFLSVLLLLTTACGMVAVGLPFDFFMRSRPALPPNFPLNATFGIFVGLCVAVMCERLIRKFGDGRSRLQFHLSTAIVMMLVAGTLLFLNMRSNDTVFDAIEARNETVYGKYHNCGWPLDSYLRLAKTTVIDEMGKLHVNFEPEFFTNVRWMSFLFNALLGFTTILAIAHIWEAIIERRSKRKSGEPASK